MRTDILIFVLFSELEIFIFQRAYKIRLFKEL